MAFTKIKKAFKHFAAKIVSKIYEKEFVSSAGIKLHYILKKKKSDKLVVVFSGFAGHYVEGRYNYIETLKKNTYNQLFIKDNEGYYKVGTYYLGSKCLWWTTDAIKELIQSCKAKTQSDKTLLIGSSKGGYAALLYGLHTESDIIVSGSPQYEPAKYLYAVDEKENIQYGCKIVEEIVDPENGFDENWIDELLCKEIERHQYYKGKIVFIYSTKEPSWVREVNRLVEKLTESSFDTELHDKEFETHEEIARYFKQDICQLLLIPDASDK